MSVHAENVVMDGWEIVPERTQLTSVGGRRMLLPVTVRNATATAAPVRLSARVQAGPGLPPVQRWLVVPGERQSVPATGVARFQVLVNPPADAPPGRYDLRLEVFTGGPAAEASTGVTRTVPVLVGQEWAIQFIDSVPSSGLIGLTESTVRFLVRGPGGADVLIGIEPQFERDDLGKFPSRFVMVPPELTLPESGLGTVTVVVVLGTSEVNFSALLVDANTSTVVARSDLVMPEFNFGDPRQPA